MKVFERCIPEVATITSGRVYKEGQNLLPLSGRAESLKWSDPFLVKSRNM